MQIKSGIYEIVNTANSKRYVGSAVDIAARWRVHRRRLFLDVHGNIRLLQAWRKHGDKAFTFAVLEHCEKSMLIEREQHYIDKLLPDYNIAPKAGSSLGRRHNEETLAKMSATRRGRKHSDETRAKMAVAARNRKIPDATKVAQHLAVSGKPLSVAHRAKMSAARLGKKLPAETRAKIGAAHRGKLISLEHRAKIGAALRGIPLSPETRAKMSRAAKARCAARPQSIG